ncbi:MAG: 4-hydroxybutyrate--acetyl-CoA CoA transferase [Clostridiales bacterium]|nr:4-hydroxybutyrate--acetyl-CoA CoA transferase [Clostridiales bacterium]
MANFQEQYKSKLMTMQEALGQIKDKSLIATGAFGQEPIGFLRELHTIYDRISEITLYGGGGSEKYPYMFEKPYQDKFFVTTNFYGAGTRANHPNGNVSIIPMHLHQCYTRYHEVWKPNVIATSATPMDKHGYFNLSLGGWELKFLEDADVVIVEVVEDMPNIPGEYELHISDVTAVVESGRTLLTGKPGELTETDIAIGQHVATLVEDGSTIQLGIGAVPDAVAQAFKVKQDLGVHTEMLTSSIADLAECGAITNRRKTLYRGKTIGAFAQGSRKLYDFLDGNLSVYMRPTYYVNDPHVIAQNEKMVSVNTCIEVDLVGQIASETLGTRQFSGTGGQNDFAEGAIHSKGGKSIIAMHSSGTNKAGERFSKIKSILTPGSVVTMSRNNIDYIVTEHGIAPMKARNIRQRVDNLIAVAHPDFREELRAEANKLMLW